MQIRAATNMIAADLEYAKGMAIRTQRPCAVVFNDSSESYQIEDPNGVVARPVKKGFQYVVNFSTDSRLNRVDIVDVNFNAASRIEFDYLGSPDNGGYISLEAGGATATIAVEPVTGFISISD
jgi:phosphotransferase system HPr-like phosphotransfer protein